MQRAIAMIWDYKVFRCFSLGAAAHVLVREVIEFTFLRALMLVRRRPGKQHHAMHPIP